MESNIVIPSLPEPFPNLQRYWKCPDTGLSVPKFDAENVEYRASLLTNAENDPILQADLLAACSNSFIYWLNTFAWTYHQFDIDVETGERIEARFPHVPFISWEIQDELFRTFDWCIKNGKDVLIDKARDMGASWCCVAYLHWLWLFRPDSQLLEMSRTQDYVDQTGNMKALFQKHDYINQRLPEWMVPPECMFGSKHRTKMHMKNTLNDSVIDGESTTEHAGSGDRRTVALLDEFAKVDNGRLIRSATRDVALVRIINSTPAGAGTEYSRWKQSGQIKVFVLPFHEHPEKGVGRYVEKTITGDFKIRSPWYDYEASVRSPQELAREVDRCDLESGSVFFTIQNIDKHMALYARPPLQRIDVDFKKNMSKEAMKKAVALKDIETIEVRKGKKCKLKLWTNLINDRPDQNRSYTFGIDISKGHGASNSVISIKCDQTNEKIGEWKCANTPPYEMAYIVAALSIWCGGRKPFQLPYLKWEMNGPGLDFGKIMVKKLMYPHFYRRKTESSTVEKTSQSYGFHTSRTSKELLLSLYDRMLAHGGYINHSKQGLEEAKMYIHYKNGGIGPACLVEETGGARATHGDIVMADALTLDEGRVIKLHKSDIKIPVNSTGYRMQQAIIKKKGKKKARKHWKQPFDFRAGMA